MVAHPYLSAFLGLVLPTAAFAVETHADYAIFRNGEKVGFYSFAITKEGSTRRIHARMHIAVEILGLTVYQASHERKEVWADNRLLSMKGRSLYNGKSYDMELRRNGASASLEVNGTRQPLGPDFFTFVPWLIDGKKSAQLITEKGRLIDMTVALSGGGGEERLRHCVYRSEEPREAWYDREGTLVQMTYQHNNAEIRLCRNEPEAYNTPTK